MVSKITLFSICTLSPAEVSVLLKGLSFCPTSSQIDYSEIIKGWKSPTNETYCFLSTAIRSKRFHRQHPLYIWIVTINLSIQPKTLGILQIQKAKLFWSQKWELNCPQLFLQIGFTWSVYTSPIRPSRSHNLSKDEHSAIGGPILQLRNYHNTCGQRGQNSSSRHHYLYLRSS